MTTRRLPSWPLATLLLTASLATSVAQAATPSSDAPRSPSSKAGLKRVRPGSDTSTPAKDPSLDFDLLNETPATNPALQAQKTADLEKDVRSRRRMLLAHQALGISTLVALAATDFVGQLNLNDKYGAGGDTAHYQLLHIGLATGTLALFTSTALMGVFAPTPYPKHFQLDSAGFHKIFMAIATAGMVAQVVLGILLSSHEGQLNQRDFATLHQVSGYTSLGAMAAGVTALVF